MRLCILLAALLLSCHGQKKHDPIDTSPQRAEVKKAAEGIKNFPLDSKAGPMDIASVRNAKNALDICIVTLQKIETYANDCASSSKILQDKYEKTESELKELKEEYSIFNRMRKNISIFVSGIFTGIIGMFVIKQFGGIIIAGIRSKLPL